MDALSLFLLVLAAAFLGGVLGGVLGYRMARLYYAIMAQRMVRGAFRLAAALDKDHAP